MNSASSAGEATERAGREAKHSTSLGAAVRVGLVAYGLVHLLVAWLAVQLAFGTDTGTASGEGALRQVAQQPFGQIGLMLVGLGFLALVVWQLFEATLGYSRHDRLQRLALRVGSGFRAVVFGLLGTTSLVISLGAGGGTSQVTWTSRLMGAPGGRWLVALVGVVIIGYGVGMLVVAVTRTFTGRVTPRGTSGELGRATVWVGQAGHAGKGVAIGIVGALFAWAALAYDPDKAGGLDAALHTVLRQPFGQAVIVVIGLGIGCYGLFCFVWARHLDQ